MKNLIIKIHELWLRLPAKLRNHLVSATTTFFVVFFALLQMGIDEGKTLSAAFLALSARAALREVVYQTIKLINKK